MSNRNPVLAAAIGIGLVFAAIPALAVTIAGPGAAVNSGQADDKVVTVMLSGIDVARGVLVAGGRTYRFDAATVGFSDDRKPAVSGGLAALKPGNTVTLRTRSQGNLPQVLQIIAR